MEFACRLYHGKHADAPSEVTAFPHLELLATTDEERESLKLLADQLRTFGSVPFSYNEIESVTGALHGARLRVALRERGEAGPHAVAPQAGPIDVSFSWQIENNADGTRCTPNNTCRGNVPIQQRVFSATPDRSGPISLAQVSEVGTTTPANSLERCSAAHASCTHTLVVRIGIKGGLALSDLDDPPVRLRVIGGSQNQSLDCDPAISNLKDELAGGCTPAYTPYTGDEPCPATTGELWAIPNPPNAWECVAVQTGNATNQVAAGLNTRIFGTDKPDTCPTSRQNHWPNYQAGDPRIVFVLVTPFGAFAGSGSTTVPVMRFAAFYITGWTGQGGGFDNPCLTQGDEMPTNPAEIVGRYIKYVDVPNDGGTSEEICDFSAIEPCAAVLVE